MTMTKVWSKGDPCMSPYSGDDKLYQGVIQKIQRSPQGQVLAVVKYNGYGDDDTEEVEVSKLQEVKVTEKGKASPSTKNEKTVSACSGGMFSPLQGNELSQRLKAKYESDEDDEITVNSERLSAVLFGKDADSSQQSKMRDHTPVGLQKVGSKKSAARNQSRKGVVVAFGGKEIKDTRITKSSRMFVEPESPSPRNRGKQKKPSLDITGGQALDPSKELISSKRVSDISSIVDSHKVKEALQNYTPRSTTYTFDDGDDDDDAFSCAGFDATDMEKPKFTFKPDAGKVPLILSEEGEATVVQVPGTLNQYLRDYQREGIKFLYSNYKNNTGAILGDDMGLGKTVQVIGFLSALLGKQGNRVDVMRQKPKFIRKLSDSASVRNDVPFAGPYLIIGPGCVLYNWLEEFETWGYFTVRKFHGTDKAECLKEIKKGKLEIVVTTFETFREHMESLNTIHWDAVIVDEVHKIKELKAKTTQALRSICTNKRFGLTGTALQNNLLEFWSILDWARPGCLGSQADFLHEFVRPIEEGQRHDATKRELATARKQKDKLSEIRKTMMIRRLKSLIADQLPRKDDSVVFCKLSQLQVSIYQTILKHPGMDYVIHGDEPCGCDSGEPQSHCCKQKTPNGHSVKSLRFTFMHLLLKTANHVALLIPTEKTSRNQAKAAQEICKAALKEHPEFVAQTKEASFKTLSDPKYCGKMKVLQGLLKVFYKEHDKVLVFSYSTQVLDIIEQHLMSTGYEYRRIDGSVSGKKRMMVVREFNTDPNIFICLISTKAGGLGLNLTGANKVVIFDPNWNPTHDLQAQDRAYRIGQRRNVQVYRLVSSGTIEENMYLRQIYKQQLLNVTVEDENARRYFYAVQGNPRMKGEIFGIKNMFILRTGESCITRDIIKRNERVESGLEGFETAQYVPPVVRLEEDDEYEDVVADVNTSSEESEDLLAQFFSSDDSEDDNNNENDSPDMEEENPVPSAKKSKIQKEIYFQEPSRGKVRPSQSRTGKGPAKKNIRNKYTVQCDQTLAGSFADVSDVFDNCGVVHIHENVKVVGGSRAEDHMTKCAIEDVYELHQHSQELAAQCEPMEQFSIEEMEVPAGKGRGRKVSVDDHNSARSTSVGKSKVLIGQTPKAIKLKHLEEMAKYHSSGSLLEFAELVLGSSLEERIRLLNQYYGSKEPALMNIHQLKQSQPGAKETKSVKGNTYSSRKLKTEKSNADKRNSSSRNAAKGISFLDDFEPTNTPTPDSGLDNNKRTSNQNSEDDMLVGRKISPRKNGLQSFPKSPSIRNRQRRERNHKLVPTACLEHKAVSEVENVDDVVTVNSHTRRVDNVKTGVKNVCNAEITNTQDLLDEISKASTYSKEPFEDDKIITQAESHETVRAKNHDVSSILDIFNDSGNSSNQRRKPPPKTGIKHLPAEMKNEQNQQHKSLSTKKTDTVKKQSTEQVTGELNDPFKLVDEIFGFSNNPNKGKTENNQKMLLHLNRQKSEIGSVEMNLKDSTLVDNDYDLFDDPKLWKKRKRKQEPENRGLVDQLIADSDADFNDLFSSGKLKKKSPKLDVPNESLMAHPHSEFDGSASLF